MSLPPGPKTAGSPLWNLELIWLGSRLWPGTDPGIQGTKNPSRDLDWGVLVLIHLLILVLKLAFVLGLVLVLVPGLGLILVHGLTCLQGRHAFIKDPRQQSFFIGSQRTHACINSPWRDPWLRQARQQSPGQLGLFVGKQMEEFQVVLGSRSGLQFSTGFIWMLRSSPVINLKRHSPHGGQQ